PSSWKSPAPLVWTFAARRWRPGRRSCSCRRRELRLGRTPANELIGPLEPSWYGVVRQARHLQPEARGKPGKVLPAAQLQRECLPAGQQEQAARIPIAAVGKGSEQRERQRNQLPQALQIARRDCASSNRENNGVEKHRPERELLCPIDLRPGRT